MQDHVDDDTRVRSEVLAHLGSSGEAVPPSRCYGSGEKKGSDSSVLSRPTDGSSVGSLATDHLRPWSTQLRS